MITLKKGTLEVIHAAGSSRYRYFGVAQFSTTDTTGEIVVPDIKKGRFANFTPIGNATGAEQPSLDETVTDGWFDIPAEGVTVDRPAGTTSGMQFFFSIEG